MNENSTIYGMTNEIEQFCSMYHELVFLCPLDKNLIVKKPDCINLY